MEQISKLLRTRMSSAAAVAEKAARYLEIVREIVQSINLKEYEKINADINNIRILSAEIPGIDIGAEDIVKSAADLYQKLAALDECLVSALSIFDNQTYMKMAVYNMSSTYTTNVYQEKNLATLAYEKYLDESVRDDDSIIALVFDKLSDADSAFIFILDNPQLINKFTIKLISWVISKTSGEKRRKMELIIEKQKDNILGVSRIARGAAPGIEGVICRYNLLPATKSMPMEELFTELGLNYNSKLSQDENMRLAAEAGPGIVLINKSTSSPVEFNLAGLIDIEYIMKNDLKTRPLSGLTKKVIERFSTANLIPRGGQSAPTQRFAGKLREWYVLESINGILWRALSLRGDKLIPADAISGMIEGVSTRPHQYNLVQCGTILNKCFDPRAQMLLGDYKEEKISLPSSEPIRAAIVDRLIHNFEEQISKHPVRTPREFRERAIDRDEINRALLDVLTHSTGSRGKGYAEYLITYIVKFDSIIRAFIKELERRWREESITDRLFKEYSGTDLKKVLVAIFKTVVTASVNEIDRSRMWTDYDLTLKEFFLERKQIII